MDSQALSRLDIQISSVMKRIKVLNRGCKDSDPSMPEPRYAQAVMRSLYRTKECITQELDPMAEARTSEASISGLLCTCTKVPGCDLIVRWGDKSLPVSGHYVAQLFDDAGAKLFDYQVILLDPILAATVIDEAHSMLQFQEELLKNDVEFLRRVSREAADAVDASYRFSLQEVSPQEAAA